MGGCRGIMGFFFVAKVMGTKNNVDSSQEMERTSGKPGSTDERTLPEGTGVVVKKIDNIIHQFLSNRSLDVLG